MLTEPKIGCLVITAAMGRAAGDVTHLRDSVGVVT